MDQKDKIILDTVRKHRHLRHIELKRIIVDEMGLMASGTFERHIKYLIKIKALPYVLVDKIKFYSFDMSTPPEATKLLLMKTGLQCADENIAKLRKLLPKLPFNEKTELATSCLMSVWGNVFDILRYQVDRKSKAIPLRLLVPYLQKLREIHDIVRKDPDGEDIEFFMDARCRPNPNELKEGEFDNFLEMRYLSLILDKSYRV